MQQERGVFPPGTDLEATISLYVMLGSIELSTDDIARVAATLAHGGVSPVSGERIFAAAHVRACLSLMASCGLYQYSGEWCFSVGLPAKSASNGLIMAVVPNVMVRTDTHTVGACERTHTKASVRPPGPVCALAARGQPQQFGPRRRAVQAVGHVLFISRL